MFENDTLTTYGHYNVKKVALITKPTIEVVTHYMQN